MMVHRILSPKMKEIAKHIGKKIAAAREGQYSQEKIAQLAKMSRSSLSYIEGGKILPSLETLYELCNILGLNIEDIIPRQEEVFAVKNEIEGSKESTPQAYKLFSTLQAKISEEKYDNETSHSKENSRDS